MLVLTAHCRVPILRRRVARCAGGGAHKYLRRRWDFAGDELSLVVGWCATDFFGEEQPRDSHGPRFVGGRAPRETRNETQPSTRQYRTLRRWRRVEAPRTWARGAGPRYAAVRVASSSRPCPAKWPLPAMENELMCPDDACMFGRTRNLTRLADAP